MACFYLFCWPVIEIVRDVVTFATLRETIVHCLDVRQAMAIGTLRNCLVLAGVTSCASNLAVLSLTGRKGCEDSIMTCGTKLRLGRRRICQFERLVRHVTGGTVCLSHRLRVGFVAVNTFRDIAVSISMAEVTSERGMLARVGNHLLVRA